MLDSARFRWLKSRCWTIREIRSTFRVPTPIAHHIQSLHSCTEQEALQVAKASRELCNGQVGF